MSYAADYWNPAPPQNTAGPSDRFPMDPHASDTALGFVAEWLRYPLDLEARYPDDQFDLYSPEISAASYMGESQGDWAPNLAMDVPNPPSAIDTQRQMEDFLGLNEMYLPGAS